jgi:cytochrome c-type biogenesis protein CcmH
MKDMFVRKCFKAFGLGLAVLPFAVLLVTAPAWAVQPDEIMPDPALEARARGLSKELRCMVCQNQSIDDSDAPLAHDLRVLVRERLQAGDTNQQVIEFLTARYGEFVLLKPPFSLHTALLWLTPIGILVIGACALAVASRRRQVVDAELTVAERARLSQILADKDV